MLICKNDLFQIILAQLATWLYLDDANVKEIGNCWSYVVDKCIKASFQPLMLLYSSTSSSNLINTNQAPQAVYQVPSNIKNSNNNLNTSINNRRSTSHLNHLLLNNTSMINKSSSSLIIPNSNNTNDYVGYVDVPDSPFAKSSTASSAYFSSSEYYSNEQEVQYISKRTVQNIINHANQQHQQQKYNNHKINQLQQSQQRNSSSSLSDSYSTSTIDQTDDNCSNNTNTSNNNNSSTNNDQVLKSTNNNTNTILPPIIPIKPVFRKELKSADAGYDSYSLSSNDSYPSIGGSAIGSTSSGCSSSNSNNVATNKSNLRSIKEQSTENLLTSQNSSNSVLADSQLLELINDNGLSSSNDKDSDKLINRLLSSSDILLLRSHEKERENDLKAAAALRFV